MSPELQNIRYCGYIWYKKDPKISSRHLSLCCFNVINLVLTYSLNNLHYIRHMPWLRGRRTLTSHVTFFFSLICSQETSSHNTHTLSTKWPHCAPVSLLQKAADPPQQTNILCHAGAKMISSSRLAAHFDGSNVFPFKETCWNEMKWNKMKWWRAAKLHWATLAIMDPVTRKQMSWVYVQALQHVTPKPILETSSLNSACSW